MKYDFAAIEKKWQKRWEETKPYAAVTGDKRPKFYGLIEFPYPSGQGLHVGHPRPFTAMDIVTRKKRMEGYNVLFPIGFDAFGLPTENYAIKNHIHPAIVTRQNIANFTSQLKMLGYGFDWDRVVDTTDPNYYKWTQWIFLQMFKKGLAYKTTMPVNWCTSCKCVLANEEVVNGVCERCGSEVIRKEKSQWMLRITKYADRLIDDLDDVDFIERVKTQQRNWIGRSTGTEVTFKTNTEDDITVYTTRVDTLFGVTYTVISPEHPLLKKWQPLIKNWDEVAAYQEAAARKSDFERGELNKDKTGVRLDGIEVVNPANGKVVPMFVSDYVLMGYGTGIVMGVPGHDQRDWDFATAFHIPIVEVVEGGDITKEAFTLKDDTGIMVNSGFLNGMTVKEAIPAMKQYAIGEGILSQDIFMDHAGFSTYESMYRARAIFGAEKVVIVTQKYHLTRAVYNAKNLGMDAYGVAAAPINYGGQTIRNIREYLAISKDFVMTFIKPEPTVLGNPISLDGSGDVTNGAD